ncbi:MAG: geranylgeranylglycerol-phosphate geranylgeranyltransferase [Bacteroidia bacterium]|nr:geranylgeranylglycerol-phosphate geranylgeranyltransferase [Bacteroidia bacterium]
MKLKDKYLLLYSFAKLIRIENLFLIALVLLVSNQYIQNKESYSLPLNYLIILIFSTISIAAGGYVINDYFDLKIDKINKPDEVVLEKQIHRKAAILWHLFFSIIGYAGGFYLSIKIGHMSLSLIQLISILLLLFYSNILKRIFILGNITIAVLSGLLPLLPYIYSKFLYPDISIVTANALISLSAFAFFTTLIRELVKDIEDIKGDKSGNRKTIPVVWGFLASKIIVFFLLLLLIIFLMPFLVYYIIKENIHASLYNTVFLIFPSVMSMFLVIIFKEAKQFHILSIILKLIMLFGIIFYLIF